jgi:hypothetical protein
MKCALEQENLGEAAFAVTAADFMRLIRQTDDSLALISLDHDLEPQEVVAAVRELGLDAAIRNTAIDPGTGRDAAEFLAGRPPACPIIIHSTNYPAALAMEAILAERDWRVERMTPYGDLDWIEEMWLPAVIRLLQASDGE